MVSRLFRDFFASERTGGILLTGCTILSLLIANSTLGPGYVAFWHKHLDLSFASVNLDLSIEQWINDGLMAIFFLLIALEIERELYIGELAGIRNAALPIAAAIGGMLIPASVHFLFNGQSSFQSGFGIPMATDIAFALGILSLLGKRVPISLKIFLAALAIIDDLGAILIIAVFYNQGISWFYLLGALAIYALLLLIGRLKIYHLAFYLIPGVAMWYCMLQSGVHPTIAGVLLAFAIPFGKHNKTSPSYKLQHRLHLPVAFVILPLFAFANTGLLLGDNWHRELGETNSVGIILGLIVGKVTGILLFSFLLIRLKWGSLPVGVRWGHMTGVGLLAGIGFTMSIFISTLAFSDPSVIQSSKVAVLVGSAISAVLGLIVLYTGTPQSQNRAEPKAGRET